MASLAPNPRFFAPEGPPTRHALECCKTHDHLCLIYDSQEEQLAAIIPFIRIGLERGEKCLYIVDESTADNILAALQADGIDVDAAIGSGALAVVSRRDAYLKNGDFDPDWMMAFLKDGVHGAAADGYTGLRITGEMTWALGADHGTLDRLIEYECRLNNFFPTHKVLAICQYNRRRFRPETLLQAIHTHPFLVSGGLVCDNPHYIPPEAFDRKKYDAASEVQRLLDSIVQNAELKRNLAAEAEQARQSSVEALRWRKLYEAVLANTPDLGYVFDLNHRFTYANDALLALWGRTWEEAIGKTCLELGYEPWHAALHDREIEQVIATRQPIRSEVPFTGTPGRRIYDYIFFPVFDEKGEVIAVAGSTRDVTDRKNTEEALRESEKRYRELLEALPVAVYTTDAEGRITLYNEAAAAFAGRRAETGKDQWCVTYRLYRPDGSFLPHDECPMAVTLRTGQPQHGVEAIAERPDGTRAWFIPHPTALRDTSGKIIGGINVLVDITERKEAEERQRQSEAALRKSEKFAGAGRMAATIAHEVNNPLEAIVNLWYLLTQESNLPAHVQELLQTLGSELSRVSHITKQTLEFYRDGKTPAPLDIAGPLNAAISLFSRKAHLAGARIETDYRTSAVTFGFAGELRQVFVNLIGNSIEAGATAIKIRVSAARDWKHNNRRGVRITFADNGSGIPADSADKLFEPFFTTKDEKGTGLGLWVSRGIVQKHEGWMRMCTSTHPAHHGTTFRLFLPTL
jgi:PAS domain S-box-containing protein